MNPYQTDQYPWLLREIPMHHPATSVAVVLNILALAEMGNLIYQAELFADMEERDAHIYAEMNKRRMAVAQLDWHLVPSRDAMAREKKAVRGFEDMIKDSLDIETLVFDMSEAIGFGFACIEMEWARNGAGLWMPVKLMPRPHRWFKVDIETRQEIRLRDFSYDGAALQPLGWITHRHASKTGYPATQGLFRVLALPYLFKNFAVKNWLRFCELYAIPIRVLFHNEKDETKKLELRDQLMSMGSNGAALLEGGTNEDLRTVDAARGEGQGFDSLIKWAEGTISKAILGGTLTSQTGANGNRSLGDVHNEVRHEIRGHDAKQLGETLTSQLVGAICKANGMPMRCRWVFDTQEPDDLVLYADAIPKMVDVGLQVPLSWVQDKLKIPMPEDGEAILARINQPPSGGGSSPGLPPAAGLSAGHRCRVALGADGKPVFTAQQQVIEGLADALLEHSPNPVDPAAIRSAILAATGPEDLERRLAMVLQGSDSAEFRMMLEQSLFAADVLGYAHAAEKWDVHDLTN